MQRPGTEDVLGYLVHCDGLANCVDEIIGSIQEGRQSWLACLNPHSYVIASAQREFREALSAADWLIPDGTGIVLASRVLGGKIRQRVTGPDVFQALHTRLQRTNTNKIFFLGSREGTLTSIRRKMTADWPGLKVVGTYSPPFRDAFSNVEQQEMIDRINAARPDVLWVGMTAPKQEIWIQTMLPHLAVRFAGAVGAVFDFYAGQVQRPGPVFQRIGLEWLVRMVGEPRRLWKRTFVSMPVFLWDLSRARVTRIRVAAGTTKVRQ